MTKEKQTPNTEVVGTNEGLENPSPHPLPSSRPFRPVVFFHFLSDTKTSETPFTTQCEVFRNPYV